MDMVNWVQILDETVCILHGTNNFAKGMTPYILPPAIGRYRVDWAL